MDNPNPVDRFATVINDFSSFLVNAVNLIHDADKNIKITKHSFTAEPTLFYDGKKAINRFIIVSYSHWNMVKERNLSFYPIASSVLRKIFETNSFNILTDINEYFNELKVRNLSSHVNINSKLSEIINKIWIYFEALIRISLSYVHEQRQPLVEQKRIEIDGSSTSLAISIPVYAQPNFMSEINLDQMAKEWQIDRKFEHSDAKMPMVAI